MPGGKGNEKGFWEDNDIVALNNQLLEESNMTWHITPWSSRMINNESLKAYRKINC